MRGSIRLFNWLGIPVYLHWTFGLLFVYVLWSGHKGGQSVQETFWRVVMVMAFFLCVLLHEYGHALMARRFGVRTRDIFLTPIFGAARLERTLEKPKQEFLVALAGPFVNLLIAIVLYLGLYLVLKENPLSVFMGEVVRPVVDEETGIVVDQVRFIGSAALRQVFVLSLINFALTFLNLIPAFPMDGGRAFRALLSMRMGRVRATEIATLIGILIMLAAGAWGLWMGEYLVPAISAVFVMIALAENSNVQMEDRLNRYHAGDIVRYNFTRLSVTDWMQTAHEQIRHGLERHFVVYDMQDKPIGIIEAYTVFKAMKNGERALSIGERLEPFEVVQLEDSLKKVYQLIRQQGFGLVGVVSGETLTGVIDEVGLEMFLKSGEEG